MIDMRLRMKALFGILLCVVWSFMPIPMEWSSMSPNGYFLALTVWFLSHSFRDGIVFPWCLGVLQDVFWGSPLGVHAGMYCCFAMIFSFLTYRLFTLSLLGQWACFVMLAFVFIVPGIDVFDEVNMWHGSGMLAYMIVNILASGIIGFLFRRSGGWRLKALALEGS